MARFMETNDILHDVAGICEGRYDLDYLGMENLIDALFDEAIYSRGTLMASTKLTRSFFVLKFQFRMHENCKYFSYQLNDLVLILKIDFRQNYEDLRYNWCKKLDDYLHRIRYYANNEEMRRREDEEELFVGAFFDRTRPELHIDDATVDLTETEIEELKND